jgi:hypothetical protein
MLTVMIDISEAQKYMTIEEIKAFNKLPANNVIGQYYVIHTDRARLRMRVIEDEVGTSKIIWDKDISISNKDFKTIILKYLKEVRDVRDDVLE